MRAEGERQGHRIAKEKNKKGRKGGRNREERVHARTLDEDSAALTRETNE